MEHIASGFYGKYVLLRLFVQPRHWALEHRESDGYGIYVLFSRMFFSVQPRHWALEHSASDEYENDVYFRSCVQPRHWELEHSASDYYERYVLLRFCVQPRHFLVDWTGGNDDANFYVFRCDCVSSEIHVRHHRSGEFVRYD